MLTQARSRRSYARLTGYGQEGDFAKMAGHDVNYIAISGVLSMLGRRGEPPLFPVNILGDFAGGGMLCAMGICLALLERGVSGKGQVVDAAMVRSATVHNATVASPDTQLPCNLQVDGASYLSAMLRNFQDSLMSAPRGSNMLDSGAHFYEVYETSDGGYMSVCVW